MHTVILDRSAPQAATPLLSPAQMLGLAAVIGLLHLTAAYSFLLFHTLVETLRIVVLGGIFVLAWHSRRWSANNFLLIIGTGTIFVAGLELLHTLSYKGLNLFPGHDANLPTQLWIAFRYLEATSFLFAALSIGRSHSPHRLVLGYGFITVAITAAVFGGYFPDCYIEGSGLTPFKIYSEFALIGLFGLSLAILFARRDHFTPQVLQLIAAAVVFGALTEVAFTQYVGVFDYANEVGHYLLLVSTYFLYRAMLVTGIVAPFDLLFRSLKQNESQLEARVAERTRALRESESLNTAFLDNSPAVIYLIDRTGRYTLANAAFERLAGRPKCDILGRTPFDLWPAETATELDRNNRRTLEGGAPMLLSERLGSGIDTRFFETSHFPLLDPSGAVVGAGGIASDVTEHRLAEERYGIMIRTSMDAFVLIDATARILEVNDACCTLTGYTREELLGLSIQDIEAAMDTQAVHRTIEHVEREGAARFDSVLRRKDGEQRDIEVSIQCLNHIVEARLFCFIRDITERNRTMARIDYLAHHDALTGLPNKLLFQEKFASLAARTLAAQRRFALAYVDLDNFKNINDTLGHVVGDSLLREVAQRLNTLLGEGDRLCRISGDEFLLLFDNVADQASVAARAEEILSQMAAPVYVDGHQLSSTVSVGLALFPEDGTDFDTLYKKADTAMFQAKAAGRNVFRFFDEAMHAEAIERIALLAELRGAIERNELRLHYQPQIDLETGALIGAEALLRWERADQQMTPPGLFIPLAEDSGLIVPIGAWVLHEACREAVRWQQQGLPPMVVAVNLSAVQFHRTDLLETVRNALAQSGLPAACLELELTESLLIGDTDAALETVRQLKALGVRLSIDDFGTGYSSLAYLKRFAVDKLKIDQSFVRSMDKEPSNATLVRTIVQMAHNLGLKTIAEGVEHEGLIAQLRNLQCDEAQGYHFARPMPPDAFASWATAFAARIAARREPENA
ncbi:bifunctional diguanylate cyclase/phosphodiesterase [Thauera sp. AutoDN2]|uniref:bifunctional diguanylate cyclase/phosphodiesterase n=1 Tax=Thauera sp. AutoDN2 TaxID=3416051 RepID=UPI003F4C549A